MHTLIVGVASAERREAFVRAADRAGYQAHFVPSCQKAQWFLKDGPVPRAIFIHHECNVRGFVAWVRGQAALFTVPVIAMVPAAGEQRFHSSHCAGADDAIVGNDSGAVTRRLANLTAFDPAQRPETNQGRCVIAFADESRRRVLGRLVRQAGFEVLFASNASEIAETAPANLIVADAVLPGGDHFGWMREKKGVPSIVLAEADQVRSLRQQLRDERCAVGEIVEPPDHLLFQANELLRPEVANVRASRRVLHGTICTYRAAGTLEPAYALTYNLSREGLYVRTLDPPARDQSLWLEVRLPYRRGAVHLRGTVVWSTGLHRPGGTTPPGFGLRLQEADSPSGDLAAYRGAYEDLLADVDVGLAQVA